jgi:hypothetical protein
LAWWMRPRLALAARIQSENQFQTRDSPPVVRFRRWTKVMSAPLSRACREWREVGRPSGGAVDRRARLITSFKTLLTREQRAVDPLRSFQPRLTKHFEEQRQHPGTEASKARQVGRELRPMLFNLALHPQSTWNSEQPRPGRRGVHARYHPLESAAPLQRTAASRLRQPALREPPAARGASSSGRR